MTCLKPTESVYRIVDGFCAAGSVSEEVFLYHRFGRYQDTFPEKPYFLLSYCAHTLFTLWRTEEECGESLFRGQFRPTAFLTDLDFESLRYTDYKRRLLHPNSLEDHWNNETQWFTFWIQILERFDSPGAVCYQEFSRRILAYVARSRVLQEKEAVTNRKAFSQFIRTDIVGHVMLRTLSVLDELMRRIVLALAGLDPQVYLLDQMSVLNGLLGQIRRTIIYQTPAKGPYTPRQAPHWRKRWSLDQLFWGKTPGTLTVIPKREGRDILCTYSPNTDVQDRRRCWTRSAASLAGPYEQELFSTWPCEASESREASPRLADSDACWVLQYEEAGRLESLSRLIDILLNALHPRSVCESLIEEVRSVSRNGSSRWTPTEIPWTYVHRLDRLLGKLTLVRREAKAMSGYDAADRIITTLWPSQDTASASGSPSPQPQGGVVTGDMRRQNTQPPVAQAQEDSPATQESVVCGQGTADGSTRSDQ
ncbi:MAG: hypothetical protein ACM3VT_12850 [Solirubrobacterales bacterium]